MILTAQSNLARRTADPPNLLTGTLGGAPPAPPFAPVDFANPVKAPRPAQPDLPPNLLTGALSLPVSPPFRQNDWPNPVKRWPARLVDQPPNTAALASVLVAGVASFVSSGPGGISVSATEATGGTGPYTHQWQRSITSGSGFSNLTGKTSLTCTDATAAGGTLYYYRLVYTDSLSTTATSNEVSAQVYGGGPLASGGGSIFGNGVFA